MYFSLAVQPKTTFQKFCNRQISSNFGSDTSWVLYKPVFILSFRLVENYGAIEGYPTAGCPHCWAPRAYWKQIEWLDSFSVATIDHKKMCIFGGGKRDLIVGKVHCMDDRLQWTTMNTEFMRTGHVSRGIGNSIIHVGGGIGVEQHGASVEIWEWTGDRLPSSGTMDGKRFETDGFTVFKSDLILPADADYVFLFTEIDHFDANII